MFTPRAFITVPRMREIDFYCMSGSVLLDELFRLLNEKCQKSKNFSDFLKGLHKAQQAFFILWALENNTYIKETQPFLFEALQFFACTNTENLISNLENYIRKHPYLFCNPGGGRQFEADFSGVVYSYYAENQIHEILEVEKGLAHGLYTEKDKNQKIIKTLTFVNGNRTKGIEHEDNYHVEIHFTPDTSIGFVENRYYFDNQGNKIKFEQMNPNKKNHGVLEEWFINGQLKYRKHFIHGVAEGEWKLFYENGNLCKLGKYENNLELLINYHDVSGKIILSEGKGLVIDETVNSLGDKLRYETNYENGLKNGIQKIYKNDILETELNFVAGRLIKNKKDKKIKF